MDLFIGLDISVRATGMCAMDAAGNVPKKGKVESEPSDINAVLAGFSGRLKRVGFEAGPLSQCFTASLRQRAIPAVCVETRHMKAALSAQIDKTARTDARGIAQMMRVGLYRPVHVKTVRSQKVRMLLTARKFLQAKIVGTENRLRGLLRNFGLKVGAVTRAV